MPIAGKGFGVISGSAGGGSTEGVTISASDFSGGVYTNTALIGKTPMTEFNVTALGSGSLLTNNVGYTFDDTTGALTMPADDYLITIY